MAYKGKYQPTFPRKYKGDPTNIIFRSLWEKKFMNYCDKNKNGVAKQWSIQSPDDITPILSEFLIISFINFHKCICFI